MGEHEAMSLRHFHMLQQDGILVMLSQYLNLLAGETVLQQCLGDPQFGKGEGHWLGNTSHLLSLESVR